MRRLGYNQSDIFAEEEASDFLERTKSSVRYAIENETDDYVLNVNEETYLDHLVDRLTVELLDIDTNGIYISSHETEIPAEQFPGDFNVIYGKSYKKDIITYHIPFTGNRDLLKCAPRPRIMWSMPVTIENNEIRFEIINFRDDPEHIKREAMGNIQNIMTNYEHMRKQVAAFNGTLRQEAKKVFDARKVHLLKKNDVLSSLGVPIKRKAGVSDTFAVPAKKVKPRITIEKPNVHEKGYKPEPSLNEEVYNSILQIIHDVGKQFERLPSTYSGKDEEQLRDHLLLMLEPNFEGSATGETFNKNGKTDILLRHEGSNVFIAECKFWSGEKAYLATIDQLLGYLTWRDSKAAIVLFVSNKDFTNVLQTVKTATTTHRNYLRAYGEHDETWLRYGIHLEGDSNREVKVAVMLFHIPS